LGTYLDQDPDFLLRLMDALIVEEVNEHAIKMFGAKDRNQLLGPSGFYWQRRPDTFRRAMESRFRGLPTFQEETKFVTLDGREIDVLFTAARLEWIGGGGIGLGGAIDITDRIRAQERLQQVQADFAHAARLSVLGEIAASIAHEVNQPLAAVKTNGETGLRWLDRPEPNVPKARELMQRILNDADRAADIIARIRAMATGRAPQQTALGLHDVIAESMLFLRHELQSKEVSVFLELAPALPQVTGDRTQLDQVIVNLVINAVQAMVQSGTGRRSIFIRTVLSDPETVCCVIEDSGPGIDTTHLPHLFDSFFTTKDSGMGIGLSICRSIIEAHDGHIEADNMSALGGARFSFALPANRASAG
jgi:PAS domain S-box-containing protein